MNYHVMEYLESSNSGNVIGYVFLEEGFFQKLIQRPKSSEVKGYAVVTGMEACAEWGMISASRLWNYGRICDRLPDDLKNIDEWLDKNCMAGNGFKINATKLVAFQKDPVRPVKFKQKKEDIMDKSVKVYFEELLKRNEPIEESIFEDILSNAEKMHNPELTYRKLLDDASARLQAAETENAETFVRNAVFRICSIASKISSANRKFAEEIISELRMKPGIVRLCHWMLADAYVNILEDEEAAKAIFDEAYEIIIRHIQGIKRGMTRKADKSLLDKPCAELISLGFFFYNGDFDDRKWLEKLADTAAGYAEGFNNNIRTAELYLRAKISKKKAVVYLKKAYRDISSTREHGQLADMVGNLLKDKAWGMKLIRENEKKCKSSLDYCILGEIASHPDGLNDRGLASKYFRIALEKAENEKQRESILDSIEDCLEEKWANGKITKIAD